MFFVVLLNSFGIKRLAEYNKYASMIKFLLPIIAIFALLYHASSMSQVSLNLGDKEGWLDIFKALQLEEWYLLSQFSEWIDAAGEVTNPQRNIPIAILGAVFIGFVLYFMLQFSFLAAIPKLI